MNMQALMRQAQQMQKDMLKAKDEIDNKENPILIVHKIICYIL